MKIGYLWQREDTDMDVVNGPVLHIRAVIDGLQRRGHTVRLATYQDGHPAWTDDLIRWYEVAPRGTDARWFRLSESAVRGIQSRLQLPYARLFDSARFADAIQPALCECDLIYERFDLLASAGALLANRFTIPHFIEVNGDIVEEYGNLGIELSRSQWATNHLLTRHIFNQSTHIITVDDALSSRMIERWRIPEKNVSVIQNGVDYDLFAAKRDDAEIRAKYGLPDGPILFFAGYFAPWQGLDILLQAHARILQIFTGAILILAGDGPERSHVEGLISDLGVGHSVRLSGVLARESIADLLSVANVAVSPYVNRREAPGLKTFEYMAAACPIVTTGWNGKHPILTHHQDALLVKEGDVEQLTEAILLILSDDDLGRRLGRAAQELVGNFYTWDVVCEKLETIFSSSIDEPRTKHKEESLADASFG